MRRRIDPRREDGVAMAEFALIVPVFMLLVVGLLVFGRLFFYWIETNHVANETARWAVVDRNPYDLCRSPDGLPGCQSLQQHARTSATNEFEDNAEVCIDYPDPTPGTRRDGRSSPAIPSASRSRFRSRLSSSSASASRSGGRRRCVWSGIRTAREPRALHGARTRDCS